MPARKSGRVFKRPLYNTRYRRQKIKNSENKRNIRAHKIKKGDRPVAPTEAASTWSLIYRLSPNKFQKRAFNPGLVNARQGPKLLLPSMLHKGVRKTQTFDALA